MSKRRRWIVACLGTLMALSCLYAAWGVRTAGEISLPGTGERQRVILRVWDVDGPTGSSAWLRAQCAAFEKTLPGLTVYLRSVPAEECFAPETVLPDVICFADGTFTAPEQLFAPLYGVEGVAERFLQSGRWQGEQYAAPLAAEGWILAVGENYLNAPVQTPAPTTLLGRAAATPTAAQETPPVEKLREQAFPLAARGQGLFALCAWLGPQPLPLPELSMSQAETMNALTRGEAASALLSTGQWAKVSEMIAQGQCAGFQPWTPPEALAPRMLYAGLTRQAQPEAAALLSYLLSEQAQQGLAQRYLFSVREDTLLYFASPWSELESSMRRSGCPVNGFWPRERVENAAWAAYQGAVDWETALAELR